MGQQQLLLIALSVIIVGIAVASGISIVASASQQANRDEIISNLIQLNAMARTHYNLPTVLGGGGHSYENFKIPKALTENGNGTFEHTQTGHKSDHIHFTGTGTSIGNDGVEPVQIEIRITSTEMTFKELN